MEKYNLTKAVGEGAYGSVWQAIHKQTGEVVAIKKFKRKYSSWKECMNLREVKSLLRMNHPNIVKFKEVILEHQMLYLVFEYLDCNLHQLMRQRQNLFTEAEVRYWCFQVFQSLAYMHHRGYFHRDLKPENLLVSKDVIKLADFGLARKITSQPPYTEYVVTRWYRAPELLLRSSFYSSNVDMWAMGAIMAELFTLRPLFPGASEADEMCKICSVIGSPTTETWADGMNFAKDINYRFPNHPGVPLSRIIPSASENAISLITLLCAWDPCKRPTAAEALQHPFFQRCYGLPPSIPCRPTSTRIPLSGSFGMKGAQEHPTAHRYSGAAATSFNAKLSYNSSIPKLNAPPNTVMPPNPYMTNNYEGGSLAKNTKFFDNSLNQVRYGPPWRQIPIYVANNSWNVGGVLEITDELANMRIGGRSRQFSGPPMRVGGTMHQPTRFNGTIYSKKVGG